MKNFGSRIPWLCLGVLLSLSSGIRGAEVNAPVTAPSPAQPSTQLSVSTSAKGSAKLPNAAAEVVKLTKAQVSEDIVISYVQNSSSTTRLTPDDIVRLRNEGVSDRVIAAMMDKNNKAIAVLGASANNAPQAPVYQDVAPTPEPAPQQPVTAPLTPSASSTYVIPYPAATAAYYGYYTPYYYPYGPYYGYGGPVFSFRFGYGGGHYGGHYHGGGIHAHGHGRH